MPNWVINKVVVNKNFDNIKKFVKGEQDFDFNKIIPMPQELDVEIDRQTRTIAVLMFFNKKFNAKFTRIEENKNCLITDNSINMGEILKNLDLSNDVYSIKEQVYLNYDFINNLKNNYNFELFHKLKIQNLVGLGELIINNVAKYGCSDWYNWRIKNWGTKWNANEIEIRENEFIFQTAWSTPEPIISRLSKVFMDTEFYVEYADEGIGNNCGTYIYKNGKIIAENLGDENFAIKLWKREKIFRI